MTPFRVFLCLILILFMANLSFPQQTTSNNFGTDLNLSPFKSFSFQNFPNYSLKKVSLSLKPIKRIIPFRKWYKPESIDPDFIYPPSRYVKPKMMIIKPDLNIDPDMIITVPKMGKKKFKRKK